MHKVTINGQEFEIDGNVDIKVEVDNTKPKFDLRVNQTGGNLGIMTTNTSVVVGSVEGEAHSGGSMKVLGNAGSVESSGSVTIEGRVEQGVQANGSVTCGDVNGSVRAGGSIKCKSVAGNASAGGSIKGI